MYHWSSRSSPKLRSACLLLAVFLVSGCSSAEERAKSYYDNGMKLFAEHDNARAAIEFKNAIKLKKDFLPAWRSLGEVDELTGQRGELAPIFRTIVELDPTDNAAKLKLARLLIPSGSLDEALDLVNAASDADNRNAYALSLKALILYKLNDAKGAIQEARAALEIDPGNAGATIVLAADRLAGGDTKGALQILNSDAMAGAKDFGIDLFKLKIFSQTQDLPQIEALLRDLVGRYPKDSEFRKQLVRLLLFQHRQDDAEKEERAIVAAMPTDSDAGLDLVRLLYAVKGPAAAQQELDSRIGAGGEVFPYQIAMADLDFVQNRFDDGIDLLQGLIRTDATPDHVLTAQLKLAGMYLSRKQIDAAEALASDILRKDSRNNSGLKLRASIHMERGELEPAINDLRVALNDQPRSTELMLLLATAYERSGSIELAERQFADAAKTSNFDPTVALNYVAFLQRRGNTTRAEDVLTELSGRWPQNIQVLSALADVRLARQNWVGAEEVASTIRRVSKTQVIADEIVGASLVGQKKFDESIGALQNVYNAAPAVQPMYALVRAFVAAKQTDKATGFLQSVLKANPSNAEALVLLGSIQLENHAPDQASKSFKAAIEAQPKDAVGYRALADFYRSQKNIEEALNVVRTGLKVQPDSGVLHLALAGLLEQKGDYEGAIKEYEYLQEKEPSSLVVSNNLASLLADHRSDQASFARAQSLVVTLRQSPVPQFKDTLGWVTYLRGDYKTAVPLLEEAARAMSNGAAVHYHLGMSYIAVGEPAKASEQLKLALNQTSDNDLKTKIEAALKKTAL
jgi:tetratricopeptide (TPR) repeat protein